ncbi:hypothetical protein F6X50_17455 [Dickeya dianthicola]|nr:hypothetical protein [Dickeya dianthicola]MZI90842.1 hypothetical protein [Dickeya dianthicola]
MGWLKCSGIRRSYLGAGLGGVLFDSVGWWSPFAFGLILLLGSAYFAWLTKNNSVKMNIAVVEYK